MTSVRGRRFLRNRRFPLNAHRTLKVFLFVDVQIVGDSLTTKNTSALQDASHDV